MSFAENPLLRELRLRQRIGLVSDFDGTLSNLAPTPAEGVLSPRNHELLIALQPKLALIALVSGRAVESLRERAGQPEFIYVGNHGLEWWENGEISVPPEASAYIPALQAALAEFRPRAVPGMWIEDKGVTASIHYRQAPDPAAVRRDFLPTMQALAAQHGLRLFEGRRIFELRPPIELDKGTAFRRLVETHELDGALFLGDDVTDVDGLRVARDLRGNGACYAVGIGVDAPETPDIVRETADVLVQGVAGVESFLEWLLLNLEP